LIEKEEILELVRQSENKRLFADELFEHFCGKEEIFDVVGVILDLVEEKRLRAFRAKKHGRYINCYEMVTKQRV